MLQEFRVEPVQARCFPFLDPAQIFQKDLESQFSRQTFATRYLPIVCDSSQEREVLVLLCPCNVLVNPEAFPAVSNNVHIAVQPQW
eukprot:1240098-Rhodomonas_salina.1